MKIKISILLGLLIFIIFSCRKDYRESIVNPDKTRTELFFTKTDVLAPKIQKIYDALKKQNEKTHFVENLPTDAGNPIWSKIKMNSKRSNTSRSTTEDSMVTAVIPLTNDNSFLSSLLKIEEVVNDSFNLNIYTNSYFYAKTHDSNLNAQRAKYLIGFFLKMDNSTFGSTKFRNIPKTCFPETNFFNSSNTKVPVILDTIIYNNTNGRLSSFENSEEPCWEVTLNIPICATPSLLCCNGPNGCDLISQGFCAGSGTQECKWATYSVDNCSSPDYDPGEPIGGGPGNMGTGSGSGGTPTGGGGGGPTGGSPTDPPCGGTWYRPAEPCSGGVLGLDGAINTFPNNPCDVIDSLMKTNNFPIMYNDLRNKVVNNFESGYLFINPFDPTNFIYDLKTGQPGTLGLDQNPNVPVDGSVHNHNNDPLRLSVYSYDDFYRLFDWYKNGKIKDSKTFTFGMVTDSTSYILMITNSTSFLNFGNTFLNNPDNAIIFNRVFYNGYSIHEDSSNLANEKNFLRAVQGLNMGLKVFKANDNLTSFSPIKLVSNNTISSDPCQ